MPLSAGQTLTGRYLLHEMIGEGGSALVYRATDLHLGRDVALKALHEQVHFLDRERFLREVRILARLSHPGVVAIHDLGQDLGRDFFTMPLLTGGPISLLGPLEDAPGSLERFLTAAAFVSKALAHIHDEGLVHRDLTPGNVLLGADGLPRIMDFGLVSMSEHTRHLTRSGVTLGTPQYMAPEQARGSGVGPSSDLYALGAVLYRVACGSPPFVGDNDQSVLFQHVYEHVPDPRELNPAIPDHVATILLHLLAKKPENRPAHARALAELWVQARFEARAGASAQYRGGRSRSGVHLGGPAWPSELRERWNISLPGEVTWPSAVVGHQGLLAVGTRSGQLALVSSSGDLHATLGANDEVTAPATLLGNGVIYGAWDGALRRASLDGSLIWTHQTRAELTGAPTLWGDRVLVTSRDGHLHAVNAKTGELAWAYRTDGPIAASPLIWGGAALIADENGWLHALDALTGSQLWKVEVGVTHATPALTPLARGEAALIVATWKGEVHALHLQIKAGRAALASDAVLWSYDLEDEVWAAPAVQEDVVVVAGWGGQVRALTLAGGDDIWMHQLGGRVTASPVISGSYVYLASELGELSALGLHSGRSVWSQREAQGVQATPLADGGSLYVAFMDGTLRAYR
ncbi:serine/threonine-protein kinase [Deinococcus psychrotolerans]|uniref:Serine/threonine-protein kinase n=1 Tax=Deinococcus psychrotolerans TaxID=2489213 RepID=A0A3G8Y9E0_9DEIO|nr:serine/threonine-protein kinase [Deinococcus psychrotolerans]AZI41978.1 serine/threonine-protein kinase [Deinococcus psychrotolerans]